MRGLALITASSLSNEPRHVFVSCGLCATKRVCGHTQSTHLVSELQTGALRTRETSDPDHRISNHFTENAMIRPSLQSESLPKARYIEGHFDVSSYLKQ